MRYLAAAVRPILVAALFVALPPQSSGAGAGVPEVCAAEAGECVQELNSQCTLAGGALLDYAWRKGG